MRIYKIRTGKNPQECETFFILCKRDILPLFVQGCYKEVKFIAELPDCFNGLEESESEESE